MNRQYFSEVVLDTVQANIRTQESFSAWDITKQVRQFIENDDFPTELLDCPLMDNGNRYNVQHERVKALVHQYMNAVLDHSNYDSVDTGKYIEYRYVDPDNWQNELDDGLEDEVVEDPNICDASCNFCSCDDVIPLATTTASADWRDAKPSPMPSAPVDYRDMKANLKVKTSDPSLDSLKEALEILKKYGLIK